MTTSTDRKRAKRIYDKLVELYPDAHCELDYTDPFELIVATILSAQCTDVRVNLTTPALFRKYPTPRKLAKADPAEVEQLIKSTGFYRNKAKNIIGAAQAIVNKHDGRVPDDMDSLLQLPGVARKTANVVLGNAYGKNEGVVVDTHVGRLSIRLGLTPHTDPRKVETDLMALFPCDNWCMLSHLLIFHGRRVCIARKPKCSQCALNRICPKIGVTVHV